MLRQKMMTFWQKFLAVIYMKYFLLQVVPCLSWVYTYLHVVIEIIATLLNDRIVFL